VLRGRRCPSSSKSALAQLAAEVDDAVAIQSHFPLFGTARRSFMHKCLLAALVVLLCPLILAQQALNNDSVVKLTKAGLSDDLIITTINSEPGVYDTSTSGLIALKSAGVSDKVVEAIVMKAAANPTSAAPSNDKPVTTPNISPAGDIAPPDEGTASGSSPIPRGARIVIAPMGGFETYFAAAVREKKVPVTLTLEKASAEYFVVSTNTEWRGFVYGSGGAANWNSTGGSAASGAAASSTRGLEASIMVIDARTKDVVWAYEVHKSSHGALLFGTFGARGQQSIAEACAKHLKEYIEKGK
jgi:hypothetical protein